MGMGDQIPSIDGQDGQRRRKFLSEIDGRAQNPRRRHEERPEGMDAQRHQDIHIFPGVVCPMQFPEPVAPRFALGFMGPSMRSEEPTSELQSLMRISYAV